MPMQPRPRGDTTGPFSARRRCGIWSTPEDSYVWMLHAAMWIRDHAIFCKPHAANQFPNMQESTILGCTVASEPKTAVQAHGATAGVQTPTHEGAARTFWRILTRFDSSKMQPYQALRNTIGVVLPLIVGYALSKPRGGLAVAIGALNVSYSDGSDHYAARAKRMLLSSVLCATAVFAGAISGSNHVVAVLIASLWAFVAGLV